MMRKFLGLTAVFLLIGAATLIAQNTRIISSGTLPTCSSLGGVYVKSGASAGFYYCDGTNWLGPFNMSSTGVFGWLDDIRQTFNPGTNAAGLNVGALAGDPGTPVNGDLWYDSTANELTARINGANVVLQGLGTATYRAGWTWAGSDLAVGTHKFVFRVQKTGTISRISLWSDTSCSAVVDIWKETWANFSATQPDNSDAIPGTNEPELSSAQKFEDTTFTGYSTTTLTAGDVLKANIDSFSGCTTLQLQIDYTG